MQPVIAMQRPVDTGGAPGTAAFTLARLEAGQMPEGRIQMLTHHTEDMVWQPRWLTHPNGAFGLAGLTIAVADVEEAAARFARFTGRVAEASPSGRTIRLDRGRLDLVAADAFTRLYPECPVPSLPFAGACGITVTSLTALETVLNEAGLRSRRMNDTLVVPFPDELGHGLWLFAERPTHAPELGKR